MTIYEGHGNGTMCPLRLPRHQVLFGIGSSPLQGGHYQIGGSLDALVDLLLFQDSILLEQLPAHPQECRKGHHSCRRDQKYEASN